jgi:hypothetical protein
LDKFWRVLHLEMVVYFMDTWSILCLLVYFMAICYILLQVGIFFPFWYFVARKIWQPCVCVWTQGLVRDHEQQAKKKKDLRAREQNEKKTLSRKLLKCRIFKCRWKKCRNRKESWKRMVKQLIQMCWNKCNYKTVTFVVSLCMYVPTCYLFKTNRIMP